MSISTLFREGSDQVPVFVSLTGSSDNYGWVLCTHVDRVSGDFDAVRSARERLEGISTNLQEFLYEHPDVRTNQVLKEVVSTSTHYLTMGIMRSTDESVTVSMNGFTYLYYTEGVINDDSGHLGKEMTFTLDECPILMTPETSNQIESLSDDDRLSFFMHLPFHPREALDILVGEYPNHFDMALVLPA